MPNRTLSTRDLSKRALVGGALAVVALAGTSTAAAFAAAPHHPNAARSALVATALKAKAQSTAPQESFADAITSVVPGSATVFQDRDIPIVGGPANVPSTLHFTGVAFTPQGGSGDAAVHLSVHAPSVTVAPPCGNAYPGWQHCSTTTLPDGSQVRTAETDNGDTVLAERTVDGVVETAIAYAAHPGDGAVLTGDQLSQVLAATAVPTS